MKSIHVLTLAIATLQICIRMSSCDRSRLISPRLPWMVKTVGHENRITKRQSSSEDACSRDIEFRQMCQSSLYEQVYVCAAYSCGHNDFANIYAASCDINEAGDWCGIYYDDVDLNAEDLLNNVENECLQQGSFDDGCPSQMCANSLQFVRNSSAGCCMDSFYNGPGTMIFNRSRVFNYTLWSQCGVEPFQKCEQTIPRTPITNTRLCTNEEYLGRVYEHVCSPENIAFDNQLEQMIREQCPERQETMQFESGCQINSQGELCTQIYNNNTIALTLTECYIGQTNCSQSCREALERIKDEQGCCYNDFFNATTAQGNVIYHETVISWRDIMFTSSYALWNQCGVETPPLTCRTVDENPEIPYPVQATPVTCNLSSIALSPSTPPDSTKAEKPLTSTRDDKFSGAHRKDIALVTLALMFFFAMCNINYI